MPRALDGWPVTVSHDLDDVLPEVDVVYLLRMQRERIDRGAVPVAARVHRALGAHASSAPAAASPTRWSCTRAR